MPETTRRRRRVRAVRRDQRRGIDRKLQSELHVLGQHIRGTCSPSSSFGTVTLTDHAVAGSNNDYIDIVVALNRDCTLDFDGGKLYLNYSPVPCPER